jgi:succinate dehydrogenase / fumarate reductase membrane anchor subunit
MNAESDRDRSLGAALNGTGHWWAQRVTAVALVPLSVWFLVAILSLRIADHGDFVRWMQNWMHTVLMVAFVAVVAQHSYLGMRVIVDDYIARLKVRVIVLLTVASLHVLLAGAGVLSVLRVAFGARP